MDGDLSDVNPGILALSKDTSAWVEQRRRAMREKIFSQKAGDLAQQEQSGLSSASPEGSSEGVSNDEVAAREAYILKQLMSKKRQREDLQGQGSALPAPAQQNGIETEPVRPQLSLKERLLQKYS